MDYHYEQLGDDRFQLFCSSIINKEFPGAQTFPVRQRDGGRDSVAYFMDKTEKNFIVFQVKFVVNPLSIKDPHKWLTGILEEELDKVQQLIPKGAKEYYLITNVKGTAHLDYGSIDKVNRILQQKISIPSMCWWRDDLNSKVHNNFSLKSSFPEIMRGTDVLGALLHQSLGEKQEVREMVIRQYLVDQYEMDNKVKFRQIDLQNNLLDLFTDVPLGVKKINEQDQELKVNLQGISNRFLSLNNKYNIYYEENEETIGAANFLLNYTSNEKLLKILLEGGPGQGKSTISQFVCQMHRIRLLDKTTDIKIDHEKYLANLVRLPFKIDLRHLATWIEGKNPYKESIQEPFFQELWGLSLKEFLVAHIYYHSKIKDFKLTDLLSILKTSNVLLVFDGFDEVANIQVRNEVVRIVMEGITQVEFSCRSLQVIVTSRPAAFSDSLEFPVDNFPHFQLQDIDSDIIKEYTDKWINACKLSSREGQELKKLVEEKVHLPHLRDLAKSPMQLAIFINLLRTKGEALPNKRTALYDNYVNLFFDREAEKNELIRDNRDLIIDIHQYLAWVLHSEAEWDQNNGIITLDDLKEKLTNYLSSHGHKHDITEIFQVVEERVCALVSRVQGTFEFEVQPLREYFCAKFLFKTSPYCPPGELKPGTRPERFDAMCKNSYWQNVLRFFAGCIDVGELPMLTQKLREMVKEHEIRNSNYPYVIIAQFLSDYVFYQAPNNQREVVALLVKGVTEGNISFRQRSLGLGDNFSIPEECGGDILVEKCFSILKTFPKEDVIEETCEILNNHPYGVIEKWKDFIFETKGTDRDVWVYIGLRNNVLRTLETGEVLTILRSPEGNFNYIVNLFLLTSKHDFLDGDIEIKNRVLELILGGEVSISLVRNENVNHSMDVLIMILNFYTIGAIVEKNPDSSYIEFCLEENYFYLDDYNESNFLSLEVKDEIDGLILKFVSKVKSSLNTKVSDKKSKVELWDSIIEEGRKVFGEKKCFDIIASIIAGISVPARTEIYDLNDHTTSLYNRVREARLKSGNINFWRKVVKKAAPSDLELLILFTWGTPRTLYVLRNEISDLLQRLPQSTFQNLKRSVRVSSNHTSFSIGACNKWFVDNSEFTFSKRFLSLLAQRMQFEVKYHFAIKLRGRDLPSTLRLSFLEGLLLELKDNENYEILEGIRTWYSNYTTGRFHFRFNLRRSDYDFLLHENIAHQILNNPSEFPRILFAMAQKIFKVKLKESIKPVGVIAQEEEWLNY